MWAEGRVGPQSLGDGAGPIPLRLDKNGALIINNLVGMYAESAYRGMKNLAVNGVAGVAPGTALSTTPPLTLWNPPSSGKVLSVLKVGIGYISGTLGAGVIAGAFVPAQVTVPGTGTELTPQNCLLGAPRGVGRAFQGSTLVAVPTLLRPIFNLGAILATSVFQPSDTVDIIDGSIAIPPGVAFCLQGIAAAGTSPLVSMFIEWDEIPA